MHVEMGAAFDNIGIFIGHILALVVALPDVELTPAVCLVTDNATVCFYDSNFPFRIFYVREKHLSIIRSLRGQKTPSQNTQTFNRFFVTSKKPVIITKKRDWHLAKTFAGEI